MNDQRLGLILKRLGQVFHELGEFIILGAQGDAEDHHERPTADIPAALPRCPKCSEQQICPRCDIRFTAGSGVDGDAPTERASEPIGVVDRATAERQVTELEEILDLRPGDEARIRTALASRRSVHAVLQDEDAPDIGQAPSNLGGGPVPLFLDGEDEDPEDEIEPPEGWPELGGTPEDVPHG